MYIEQKQDKILRPNSVYTKSAAEDNQITTELLNLITEGGLTPSANDLTQVKTAVLNIAGGGTNNANKDLSNLSDTGKNIGNWSTNVSNCITEIPQVLDITLSSGTLTVKAGSKVYVPNGFEQDGTTPKFDTVTLSADITRTETSNYTWFLFYNATNGVFTTRRIASSDSGTSNPSATWAARYNTATNKVVCTDGSGTVLSADFSLPVAMITTSGGAITSIDKVFNGFGYIGSVIFAFPGVSGLIPDGRNADGTLKSTPITLSAVSTAIVNGSDAKTIILQSTGALGAYTTSLYHEDTNYNTNSSGAKQSVVHCGTLQLNSDSVVEGSFHTKTVFHASDSHYLVTSYNNGTSWYRVYSDGWCEQGGTKNGSNNLSVTLLKEYPGTDYSVFCQNWTTSNNTTICTCKVNSQTSSGFTIVKSNSSDFSFRWRAEGYL